MFQCTTVIIMIIIIITKKMYLYYFAATINKIINLIKAVSTGYFI